MNTDKPNASARCLAFLLPALFACQPTWAEAPRVHNPVLLGPIDRVGSHRASGGSLLVAIDDEVNASASSPTMTGNYVVRETESRRGRFSIRPPRPRP
jgi:hypothetical protein